MAERLHPHHNDCEDCEHLGNAGEYDLYFCAKVRRDGKGPLLVAVSPHEKFDLVAESSEEAARHPALKQALNLANREGHFLYDQRSARGS